MLNRPPLWIVITAVTALASGLSACGGGAGKAATTPSSSATSASRPTTTSTASSTTNQAGPRTVAELKSALLALDDLPTGFAIEAAGGSGGDDGSSSSKDPATGKWMDDLKPVIEGISWLSDEDRGRIFEANPRSVFPRFRTPAGVPS